MFTSRLFVLTRVIANWNISVIWIMTILSILRYVFLGGVYYSECIYSMYGRLRAVMSMLSYDIILMICLVIYGNVWLLLILFIFSAEVGRTPVDLVERESELVSGFNTEYAGGVFVRYFLGEYLILTLFFIVWWQSLNVRMILLCIAILFRASYPRIKYQELMILFWRSLFVAWAILIMC
jgi:NADH:ubiquinone oxidoreductase subunit H